MSNRTVSVLGGGSFGTVIANIIAGNGYKVSLWMRSAEQAAELNRQHENTLYLPGYKLHDNVHACHDMSLAVSGSEVIFVALPSDSFRMVVGQMLPYLQGDEMLVSTTKGIEANGFKLMSQVLQEQAPDCAIGVLSGPNLAKEIAARQLAGTVIASPSAKVLATVQRVLSCDYFRVYANNDMFGVELGGSLKNIYAIIAGLAAALGMGHNTNSMLVTRSLTEMARFAVHLGADPMTFLGLSGVGDLVVTCSSALSRNYRVGYALGSGKGLEETLAEMGQVAEGINTLKLVKEKADELGVYMPLASGLYEIIYQQKTISQLIRSLMLGEQALDVEFEVGQANKLN